MIADLIITGIAIYLGLTIYACCRVAARADRLIDQMESDHQQQAPGPG